MTIAAETLPWWKRAVIYQIYPRSFQDSDGDGIGDLPGITARLDHLAALGVDAVWLSPHFASPNADNGYDISDYRQVMPEFGTMADFDTMLAGMQARGIRLILDLVVNHTSDEHVWFQESRKGRDSRYRDFYIWRDGVGDGPPNNYRSFFGGPAWTRDDASGQYYLHYFHRKQPDLNWENPAVRAEVHAIMRFWLDKGVAGFRMDVIPFVSKPPGLPDLTPEQLQDIAAAYACGPNLHAWLRELHDVLAPYDAIAIGEAFGVSPEQARDMIDARRCELNLALNFDIVRLDRDGWRKTGWRLPELKALYARLDRAVGDHGWNSVYLENHDSPRIVSHFGDPDSAWRERSARVLATLLLTQRGTPFLYQGQEIGMANFPFRDLADFADVEVSGQWHDFVESGKVDAATFLMHVAQTSRDNARTPMQWTPGPNAGFTTGVPWLAVNPDHAAVNVEQDKDRPGSVLETCRTLMALRRAAPDLVTASYLDLDPDHPYLFAYQRGGLAAVLNFSRTPQSFTLPAAAEMLFATDAAQIGVSDMTVHLGGWEGLVVRLV